MALSTALSAALSGLKASQAGLDLVAANVANAGTAGYVKKTLVNEQSVIGGQIVGVRTDDIRRELDVYLQRQLRTEAAGASYASTRADYLDRLQLSFGTPEGGLSLDKLYADFSSSLDALATTPDDESARAAVLQSAQIFAQQLNAASRDVQELRAQADQGLAAGVETANEALRSIESLTDQIVVARTRGESVAGLLDQRDVAIDALASLMDIRVEDAGDGEIRIKTPTGLALYDGSASTLTFEPTATVDAGASYAPNDPSGGGLGTIRLTRPSGYSVDLLAPGQLRSGQIRALADMRDKTLPQAQTQLDELAANLAQALGTNEVAGSEVAGGVDLTIGGAQRGDRLTVSYTSGGTTRSVTIVNVGDASRLPLDDSLTADPNDTVIGVDFTSPAAAANLDAALAAAGVAIDATTSADGLALSSSAPGLAISRGSSAITATGLSGSGLALPVFVDGAGDRPYSGNLDGGDQRTGFASRITINPALLADPSKLAIYAPGTAAGDSSRPDFLRDALAADRPYLSDTGLGGSAQPFSGSVGEFASGIVAMQARASASATRVADGQSLVMSSLQDRYSATSGVDVDEEMSRLIQLQTAYGANARVVTAVKEMMDMLLNV
jgi:flagellar hook-associated protein 1 FlgK